MERAFGSPSHRKQELYEHDTIHDPANLALGQKAVFGDAEAASAEPLLLEAGQISLHDVYHLWNISIRTGILN